MPLRTLPLEYLLTHICVLYLDLYANFLPHGGKLLNHLYGVVCGIKHGNVVASVLAVKHILASLWQQTT